MKIEVHTDQEFSTYQQFDPFKLKTIRLFHVECMGGAVEVDCDDYNANFRCTACGECEGAPVVESRAAVRRLLIVGDSQNIGAVTFVPHGKASKPRPAT